MENITTEMSDTELTEIGRAMEREGFTDLKTFAHWAILDTAKHILSEK